MIGRTQTNDKKDYDAVHIQFACFGMPINGFAVPQ
jgi:hypothetical protein